MYDPNDPYYDPIANVRYDYPINLMPAKPPRPRTLPPQQRYIGVRSDTTVLTPAGNVAISSLLPADPTKPTINDVKLFWNGSQWEQGIVVKVDSYGLNATISPYGAYANVAFANESQVNVAPQHPLFTQEDGVPSPTQPRNAVTVITGGPTPSTAPPVLHPTDLAGKPSAPSAITLVTELAEPPAADFYTIAAIDGTDTLPASRKAVMNGILMGTSLQTVTLTAVPGV